MINPILLVRHGGLILVGLLWFGVLAGRADHYVATNGPHVAPFDSWDRAASNDIQAAINAASVDETVWVSNGTYLVTNQIMVTNRITVQGFKSGFTNTVVAADWPVYTTRVFYVTHTGTVDGFTISNGHCYGSNDYAGGGGAYLTTNGVIKNCYLVNNITSNSGVYAGGGGAFLSGSAVVSNCVFFTNMCWQTLGPLYSYRTGYGGAIFLWGTRHKVLNCTIISNCATDYGGIIDNGEGGQDTGGNNIISNCVFSYCRGGAYASAMALMYAIVVNSTCSYNNGTQYAITASGGTWINLTITNNTASTAAIRLMNKVTASNCIIAGNSSGGLEILGQNGGNADADACRIFNNTGAARGGVYIKTCGRVRNSLIYNNTNTSSSSGGGGVYLTNAALTPNYLYGLINCTVVNNYSAGDGGGVSANGPSNYVANCIIAGNSSAAGAYPNVYHESSIGANSSNYYYSCAVTTDAYLFAANQGNITNDPIFKDPGAGNWQLNANSPCINAGMNQGWMTNNYDLDGRTRIRYGTVDMGAYERINEGTVYKLW